jgi:hypothetical protein
VIWHGINGDGQGWRRDSRLLRAYTWATLLWALVFTAPRRRPGPALSLRGGDLGWASPASPWATRFVGIALLGTIWAVRRARRAPQPAG